VPCANMREGYACLAVEWRGLAPAVAPCEQKCHAHPNDQRHDPDLQEPRGPAAEVGDKDDEAQQIQRQPDGALPGLYAQMWCLLALYNEARART
jgi:hypothetical protein